MADKHQARWIVGALAVAIVAMALAVNGLMLLTGESGWLSVVIRLAVTVTLCWFMFDGDSWARWANAAFSAIGGIHALFTFLAVAARGQIVAAVLLGLFTCFYLGVAILLAFSRSVAEYYREPLMEGMFTAESHQQPPAADR